MQQHTNRDISKETISNAIDNLRFPMAVMVAATHCYYFNLQNINTIPGRLERVVEWVINTCSIVLTDCAVPMFFVISGYLFFLRQDGEFARAQYKVKMLKKCKTLLLPFFIWNILGALSYPGRFIDATLAEKLLGFWSQKMEWGSGTGPWDGPLWFLRDLFVVMLFSPVIYQIIKKIGIWFIILMAIPLTFMDNTALCPGLSGTALFWFSLGSFLTIKAPVSLGKTPMSIVVSLAAIFFVFRILVVADVINGNLGKILNMAWIIVSMAFYFRVACIIVNRNTPVSNTLKKLGASSFVIFAMHSLINGKISSVLLFIAGKQNVGDLLTITFYFATIILTVAMCYCFHLIVKKNNITSLLFEGGRKR